MVVAVVSTRQMSPGSGRSRLAEAHKNDVPPLASTWGIVRSTNPDPTSLLMTRVIPRKQVEPERHGPNAFFLSMSGAVHSMMRARAGSEEGAFDNSDSKQ